MVYLAAVVERRGGQRVFRRWQSITRVLWTGIDQQWYSKDLGASCLNGRRGLVRGERNDGKGFEWTPGHAALPPSSAAACLEDTGSPPGLSFKAPS